MYYFTSITTNYLAKARVLAKTLKLHNKEAKFIVSICDDLPENFNILNEPFDGIIKADELELFGNTNTFFFKYNVTEICTAVKPGIALEIMNRYKAQKVVYLDPDIAVFSDLNEIKVLLDKYSMIFVPHSSKPDTEKSLIIGNEILFLKKGVFNLGFFAVKNDDEGCRFLKWWHERLFHYCLDDDCTLYELLNSEGRLGTFTDQKWIDLVPCFFDNYYILKTPGYDVATWNLSNLHVFVDKGNWFVDGYPLRFFHFSSFDSGHHHSVLDLIIELNSKCKDVKKLSEWYERELKKAGQIQLEKYEWKYARYSNGELIPNTHRKIFNIRQDIHDIFQNPFEVNNDHCFYNWVNGEYGDFINNECSKIVATPKAGKTYRLLKRAFKKIVPRNSKLWNICRQFVKR